MKIQPKTGYLDELSPPTRSYGWLGLHRLFNWFRRLRACVEPDAAGGIETKIQQYLDRLRDQGPVPSGAPARPLPLPAPDRQVSLQDAA